MHIPRQPDPLDLIDRLFRTERRAILLGDSGTGKTTLIACLMTELAARGQACYCINCDPGLPGCGLPGTLSLARLNNDSWTLLAVEPICSLDAARFRLPVLTAVKRLLAVLPPGTLFLDSPGLVRGIGGAELIPALAEVANVDVCLTLLPEGSPLPLANELRSLAIDIVRLEASPAAQRLARTQRGRQRSQLWADHLAQAQTLTLTPANMLLLGTPPPLACSPAWEGRQIALLQDGHLQTMGEVVQASSAQFLLKVARTPAACNQLLVRDAVYRDDRLHTAPKHNRPPPSMTPNLPGADEVRVELGALTSIADEPQVVVRVGHAVAALVNGVMGDPLLQLRMLHQSRSLLFDIGDTGRMPLRAAHQVTDLFISHAHADHIGGFMWLIRCRIGHFPPCRVYGPPGVARQVSGMVSGLLWDRVEDRGPCFEVNEWHGSHLKRWRITAGRHPMEPMIDQSVVDGVIHREPGFIVRATELDHGTPVLAYAYEPRSKLQVRREKLAVLGVTPGPWLQTFKQAYLNGRWEQKIALGDGRTRSVDDLAQTLLLEQDGEKLVYATDFKDSDSNIARLTKLAQGAHTLFCEASFILADRDQAERTQHLTTEACARIANLAQVRQLVAFHFSHRYESRRALVYQELQQFTDRVVIPRQQAANSII